MLGGVGLVGRCFLVTGFCLVFWGVGGCGFLGYLGICLGKVIVFFFRRVDIIGLEYLDV